MVVGRHRCPVPQRGVARVRKGRNRVPAGRAGDLIEDGVVVWVCESGNEMVSHPNGLGECGAAGQVICVARASTNL
jgi:hypothetical protein